MRASPVGHPPTSRQARASAGPAARWIAPQTPPPGLSSVLAAFTIASRSSVVMSARLARSCMHQTSAVPLRPAMTTVTLTAARLRMTRLPVLGIVVAALLRAEVGAQALSQTSPGATRVFTGRFITLDSLKPRAQAVAVRDGRILAVGSRRYVDSVAGPGAAH